MPEAVTINADAGSSGDGRTGRRVFMILVVIVAVMRLAVLAGSQRWLNWDECIVGLTAVDVLHGNLHIYFPGQAYGGGSGVEAVAIAALFGVFGVSATAVKAYALVASMASLVAVGWFVRRAFGWTAANWACVFWATAPGWAIMSLQVRGGYIEIQLLTALVLLLFHRVTGGEGVRPRHWFLLGLVSGLSYYTFGFALPLLFAVGAVLLARDKLIVARGTFWLGALGFVVGIAPMIYYDLTHAFAHLQWVAAQRNSPEITMHRLWIFLSVELFSYFRSEVDDFFLGQPPVWYAWILGGLTYALVIGWVVSARRDIAATARWMFRRRPGSLPPGLGLQTGMVLFIVLYFVFYLLGRPGAPRYFLGLYPVLTMGMGICVAASTRHAFRWIRVSVVSVGAVLVVGGLLVNLYLMNLPGLRDALGRPKQREVSVRTEPGGVADVVTWLRDHEIQNVFAHPVLKWKLIFYGYDRIRGSASFTTYIDDGKLPALALEFEESLHRGEPFAFVFHREFRYQGLTGGWVAIRGPAVAASARRRTAIALLRAKRGPPGREALVPYSKFFFDSLRRAGVTWKTKRIGDYLIVHGFGDRSPIPALRPLLPWVEPM